MIDFFRALTPPDYFLIGGAVWGLMSAVCTWICYRVPPRHLPFSNERSEALGLAILWSFVCGLLWPAVVILAPFAALGWRLAIRATAARKRDEEIDEAVRKYVDPNG